MEGTALLNRLRHPLRRRPIVAMWAMGQEELSNAECARKGIEAVAGLVMEADIFGVYLVPGANFQTCVEFYYSGTDTSDFIGVYFRKVDILTMEFDTSEDTPDSEASDYYDEPSMIQLGEELLKMAIQPVSDQTIVATWGPIERSRADESLHGVGMIDTNAASHRVQWRSLPLGYIPPQAAGDFSVASFLIAWAADTGMWRIWRHFGPRFIAETGYREESYVPVYPDYDPGSTRRYQWWNDGRVWTYAGAEGHVPTLATATPNLSGSQKPVLEQRDVAFVASMVDGGKTDQEIWAMMVRRGSDPDTVIAMVERAKTIRQGMIRKSGIRCYAFGLLVLFITAGLAVGHWYWSWPDAVEYLMIGSTLLGVGYLLVGMARVLNNAGGALPFILYLLLFASVIAGAIGVSNIVYN